MRRYALKPRFRDPETGAPCYIDCDALSAQDRTVRVLNEFAMSLMEQSTVHDIVWDIAKKAVGKLGFEDCVVYLVDDTGAFLNQAASHGPKNPQEQKVLDPIVIPVGKGIVGSVAATMKPEIVPDTRKDDRYIRDDSSRLSEMAIPIVFNGECLGVIDSEHTDVDFYTEEMLRIVTSIASMAASRLSNARAVEQLVSMKKRQRTGSLSRSSYGRLPDFQEKTRIRFSVLPETVRSTIRIFPQPQ